MRVHAFLALAAAAVLAPAAEQPLSFERTFKLGGVAFREIEVDPPKADQKLTVTATSTKEPINVFVVLKEDRKQAEEAFAKKVKPEKSLAGKEDARKISFEATVPAGKGFVVYVCTAKGAGKDTEVKLTLKGR